MRFVFGLAALAFSAVLAGCGQQSGALAPLKTTPAEAEAHITKLTGEAFTLKAEGAADLAAVRDALPGAVSLSWGALSFDSASGATVLTDVKLTAKDFPDAGLGIAEVRLWDFDADFAKARLTGQRLTEAGPLARRIEAKGFSVFGLEKLAGPAMDAANGAITDAVEAQMPGVSADVPESKLESYDIGLGRLIIDDLVLRPWSMTPAKLEPGSEFAEAMPFLQTAAALARSFAADSIAALDAKIGMTMTEGGQPIAISLTADSYGLRGIRGGDTDASYLRNAKFKASGPSPYSTAIASGAVPPPPPGLVQPSATMAFDGGIDYASVQEMRLDKLFGYVTKGEWPPRTDTNLFSYGLLSLKNEHFGMDGKTFFSIGEMVLDARKWHWFIPTDARIDIKDAAYDLNVFNELIPKVEPVTPDGAPTTTIPPEVMTLLTRYGIDQPSFDFSLGWKWNPTSGATVVDLGNGMDKFIRMNLKYEGGFPSFKAVSDLIPDNPEQADEAAIGDVFGKATSFKAIELEVIDEGGLEKLFGILSEVGKMIPPDQTGGAAAMFANQTPQSIRALATAGAYMMADQAEMAMPGVRPLLAPFGVFVDKGGRVKFTAKPRTPMVAATVGERIDKGELTPDAFLKELNATTVHTPPPAGN